jgi:hypothetical protein
VSNDKPNPLGTLLCTGASLETSVDDGRQFTTIDPTSEQEQAIVSIERWLELARENRDGKVFVLAGYAGTGKALAFDQEVQTPEGPRPIGLLRVGDAIFRRDGSVGRVTGVFPQGIRQAFRVTFRDGAWVECDGEHLWSVWSHKHRQTGGALRVMALNQIVAEGLCFESGPYKWSIPLCQPLEYSSRDLPVDPYLLGLLIGDGTYLGTSPTLVTPDMDAELVEAASRLLPSGMTVTTDRAPQCPRHLFVDPTERGNRLGRAIRGLDLDVNSPERFVPLSYLYSSVAQRQALLQGLMDTDGSCVKNRTSFSTMSLRLKDDVVRLVQSLGGTAIAQQQLRGEWQVNIKVHNCPFRLRRKAARWSASWKNPPSRFIVRVEPTRVCEHVCIKVDAGDELFLTKDHIVTHNTAVTGILAADLVREARVAFAAPTGMAAAVLARSLAARGVFPDYCGTIHSLLYRPLVDDATGAHTGWERKEKLDYDLLVIDEASMVSEELLNDLVSYNIPLLAIGDGGQLPPVGEDVSLMAKPHARLIEVHRQALDNPVVALSVAVRQGADWKAIVRASRDPRLQYQDAFDSTTLVMDSFRGFRDRPQSEDPLVICGMNHTRKMLNDASRTGLGPDLVVGDRVTCLRNQYFNKTLLANGFRGTVKKVAPSRTPHQLFADVAFPEESLDLLGGRLCKTQFGRSKPIALFTDVDGCRSWDQVGLLFDYGNALTCHRAQGQQRRRVILVVEDFAASADEFLRWLYTGITRCVNDLVVMF